jgi:hypothetical protein
MVQVVTAFTAVVAVLIAAPVPLSAYLRRPKLTLAMDARGEYTVLRRPNEARIPLLAHNARRRRAAHGTRVELIGCRSELEGVLDATEGWAWYGNLPFRWTGRATEGAATVYAGATRPVDFLSLSKGLPRDWQPPPDLANQPAAEPQAEVDRKSVWLLHLGVREGATVALSPGRWVIRVLIGAREGDAATYDVAIEWSGATTLDAAFNSLELELRRSDPSAG